MLTPQQMERLERGMSEWEALTATRILRRFRVSVTISQLFDVPPSSVDMRLAVAHAQMSGGDPRDHLPGPRFEVFIAPGQPTLDITEIAGALHFHGYALYFGPKKDLEHLGPVFMIVPPVQPILPPGSEVVESDAALEEDDWRVPPRSARAPWMAYDPLT